MKIENANKPGLTVNLVYGTYGESGILTSIINTKKMLRFLESEGVKFFENSYKVCDVMHAQTFGPIAFVMALAHKLRRKKVIIHAHTTHYDMKNSYRGSNFLSKCLKWYLSFYYNLADVCIAPSDYTKGVLLKTLKLKTYVVVLSNGIDVSMISNDASLGTVFRKKWRLSSDPIILSVGFAFIRKGIVDFIEVAKRLPDYKFVWVGRILGDLFLPRDTKKIIENAPPNVLFTGKISDVREAFNAADMFVFPSYEENQGIAALEAAAYGLPIVMRDLSVYAEYEDRVNCLKFHTIEEFTAAVEELILNESAAKKLGKNAQLMAQQHDLHVVSKRLFDIYLGAT
jgi:1,2-diacylglycerol-3-alpha-glucose alpha-1,2-glucosyltransferase